MRILHPAEAGRQTRWDCLVAVLPPQKGSGLDVQIDSTVGTLFGPTLKKTIEDHLRSLGVEAGTIRVNDDGALDYVLRARVECAVRRASKETSP